MLVTEREKRHGALGPRRLLPDGSDDGTVTSCGVVRPVPFIQTVLFCVRSCTSPPEGTSGLRSVIDGPFLYRLPLVRSRLATGYTDL
jgi:hypothetical protein